MPQLLLEFFSEETPARMQKRAEEDLARLMLEKLSAAGFLPEATKTFSTPRRLTIVVEGLPARTPDVREEKKGPRVGAPEKAIEGFLKGAGLSSIDQAKVQADPKGDFYVAVIEKKGRETAALIGEIAPEIVRAFPWPKSMRSGESDLTWVRPLQNICCTFDGEEIVIALDGVASKAQTRGHRFHAGDAFNVKRFEDYEAGLRKARVVLDREERKAIISADARTLCAARNLELVEDAGLLEEVAGLVEWPVPLMGDMDPAFLDLPAEVIRLSMRTHQKYFAVRDPKGGKLAPHFVTVANVSAKDGGKAIAAGNARVLSARLNDARFFWDTDKKTPLFTEERRAKLEKIVFHQKLGSVWDKVERVKALAVELCAATGADAKLVERAALLCKMDLVTETVGEFPELQGQVGRQLAELIWPTGEVTAKGASAVSEHPSVAAAIEDHYRPLGPNDRVPSDPVAVTLALADKLDTLVGFWAIGEKPTGSSDAYGLRRAALGFVRTVLANDVRFPVFRNPHLLILLLKLQTVAATRRGDAVIRELVGLLMKQDAPEVELLEALNRLSEPSHSAEQTLQNETWNQVFASDDEAVVLLRNLAEFLADRLKVQLREQGKRHDLVDAVFALGDDDLVRIVARVEALSSFLATEDGANLLAGYKRAANILRAEERKADELSTLLQSGELAKHVNPDLFRDDAERALHAALEKAAPLARAAVEREDFSGAMAALAPLRARVDAFFEAVMVNDPDPMLRRNRLALLSRLRAGLHEVADFSKIEG